MVELKSYPSVLNPGCNSERGVVLESGGFNGSLFKDENITFFYRIRRRYYEFIPDHSTNYSIGIEDYIINDLYKENVDSIVVETEFNTWEISLSKFIEECYPHGGIKGLIACPESYFSCVKKSDRPREKDRDLGSNDPEARKIRRQARINSIEAKLEMGIPVNQKQQTEDPGEPEKKKVKFGEQFGLF